MRALHTLQPKFRYNGIPVLSENIIENLVGRYGDAHEAEGHLFDVWAENNLVMGLWRNDASATRDDNFYIIKTTDLQYHLTEQGYGSPERLLGIAGQYRERHATIYDNARWSVWIGLEQFERSNENVIALPELNINELKIPPDQDHDETDECEQFGHDWDIDGYCTRCTAENG